MGAVAAWPFVDGWFSTGEDMVQSTIKIRQAGFHECADTHESFRNNFSLLRQLAIVP